MRLKVIDNVLSKEQCQAIINSVDNFEDDKYITDIGKLNKYMSKEELESNMKHIPEQYGKHRKVQQAAYDYFKEWDGLPVYRSKVMKYEEGDFTTPHKDSQWMCMSNYWKENTNKASKDIMIIPLNDDYEGGEFTVADGKEVPQKVGSCIQFDQSAEDVSKRLTHGVGKVTKGTRYSLVFWNFK